MHARFSSTVATLLLSSLIVALMFARVAASGASGGGKKRMLLKTRAARNFKQGEFPVFTEARCTALPVLICNVVGTTNNPRTSGTVLFSPVWRPRAPGATQQTCFTRVQATLDGLVADTHAMHIHSYGDLSTADGTSTGGHFGDPSGADLAHGYPGDAVRHWGDLGNITRGASGLHEYDRVDDVIRLGGIVGRAITVHEGADLGASAQPTGGAGGRLGFCVIGYSNPKLQSS